MPEQIVTLPEFAKELGLNKSQARKTIKALEVETGRAFMQRGRVRGGQSGLVLTREAADAVLVLRRERGFTPGKAGTVVTVRGGVPTVYVIALHGLRLKFGFTDGFAQRLIDHRTTVPDLEVLRCWALPQAYEVVMMDLAAQIEGVRKVGGEVFQLASEAACAEVLASIDDLARRVKAESRIPVH